MVGCHGGVHLPRELCLGHNANTRGEDNSEFEVALQDQACDIEKFNARFVARGFSQEEGVDYEETSAPVAKYISIRAIMSLVSFMWWRIHKIDVKTTFLNRIIEEEVYIEHSQSFKVNGKESHVYRLKKALYGLKQALKAWYSRIDGNLQSMGFANNEAALYGLKQAPKAWYSRIDDNLQSMGFANSEADSNLYYIFVGTSLLILVLYVLPPISRDN
jgi:hypothetical protein